MKVDVNRKVPIVGAVLAVLGIAAAIAVPLASAASPKACSPSRLTVSFRVVKGSAGAGGITYKLKVKSKSSKACTLGRPKITLLDKNKHRLPSHAKGSGKSITLAAHGKASAVTRFSPDVTGKGDMQSGPCEPTAYFVKVRFKGSKGAVTGPIKPPTPVCSRGKMRLKPLK